MDKQLLIGDNQFFGVNHMSEERALARAIRFQDTAEIIGVLNAAVEEGIHGFMCTTHARVAEICDHVRANPHGYEGFGFYPCMPYAHKYANAVTNYGVAGALRRFLPEDGLVDTLRRGSGSVLRRDVEGITTLLIDAEMRMFSGLRTPVIFLQNIVVDLLLGTGIVEPFRTFAEHVRNKYGAEPGFMTMNLPALLPRLEAIGIENPIVCASMNKLGFRMCGGLEAYQTALDRHQCRAIAMSVFASGAIPAGDAIRWVCEHPNVDAVVFGASTRTHIAETRDLIQRYWGS